MRPARLNTKLSAYAFVFGNYNYDSHPIAPPGSKCEVHLKPAQRKSFGSHSISGWYVGPAMEHYRCYKVYIPSTRNFRISDTVDFFPAKCRLPQPVMLEQVRQAALDLIKVLKQKPKHQPQPLTFGHTEHIALQKLAEIFQKDVKQVTPTSTPTDNPTPTANTEPPVSAPRVQNTHVPTPRVLPSTQPTSETALQRLRRIHRHQPRRSPRLQSRNQHLNLLQKLCKNPKYKDFLHNHVAKHLQSSFTYNPTQALHHA